MVDIYHLFKLGVSAGRILKATKGAYNTAIIFKNVAKPLAVLGVSGFADAALDEYSDKLIDKLTEEAR